jgi:peptidoglycan L-alanyl-D-glutamate endopeptidase CwlK
MSYQFFPDDVLFFQRLLKTEGLYERSLDGIWGKYTEDAATEFERRSNEVRASLATFDQRSERHITTLTLQAQRQARLFLQRLLDVGINARIISGTRTYAEQNLLYSKGRFGNPGPVVTNAKGGASNHNFGIAWDIGVFTSTGGYVTTEDIYRRAAEVGLSSSLEWGGHWQSFPDPPHYQSRTNLPLIAIRDRFEAGQAFPVLA